MNLRVGLAAVNPRIALVLACALSVGTHAGCTVVTRVGGDCPDSGCAEAISCDMAEQHLPDDCDRDARSCHGVEIGPDTQACTDCIARNESLGIKNRAIVTCACAHCAAQLTACFESSRYEADGDVDRDNWCRIMVECGWASKCVGSDCYCGAGVDRVTCLREGNAGRAAGPCASLIAQAAGCTDSETEADCALGAQLTADTAVYRATAVAQCVTGDPLLAGAQAACSPDLYELD